MSGKKSMIAIALLLAISILALLFVSGNIHMESEQKDALKITFLKVGKVDAIIAQTQEKTMVIDAGEEDDGEEVVSFLTNQGVFKVDVLIITHYDQDHVGGADTLVESLDVAQVFLPDYEGNHIEYLDFMTSLDEKNIKPQLLTEPIEPWITWLSAGESTKARMELSESSASVNVDANTLPSVSQMHKSILVMPFNPSNVVCSI